MPRVAESQVAAACEVLEARASSSQGLEDRLVWSSDLAYSHAVEASLRDWT